MKRLASLATAIFLLLITIVPFCHADDALKVRVAVILPLSGEAASWGEAFKNGMTLAMEKLSDKARSKLDFVYEDDALSSKNSVSALNRVLTTGPVDVVVNVSSGTGKALAPVTEQKKIPFLSVASDSSIGKGRKYAFNFWVTPEEEARALIPEMRKRGYKNIARINSIHAGVLAFMEVFDAENNGQVKVILNEEFDPATKDFKTFIAKIKAKEKDIDAVMVGLLPGQLNVFSRQLREMGVKKDIFGWETIEDANEVKLSNETLVGAWYVNADDGDGSFLKSYGERFPGASSYIAANGYDTVLVLASAIDKGIEPKKINEYLASLKDFSGALGTYSSTGDQRFSLPARVKVVTKDGFQKLG